MQLWKFGYYMKSEHMRQRPQGVFTSGSSMRILGQEFGQPRQGDRETHWNAEIRAAEQRQAAVDSALNEQAMLAQAAQAEAEAQADAAELAATNVGPQGDETELLTSNVETPNMWLVGVEPGYKEHLTSSADGPPHWLYEDRIALAKRAVNGQTEGLSPLRSTMHMENFDNADLYSRNINEPTLLQQMLYPNSI